MLAKQTTGGINHDGIHHDSSNHGGVPTRSRSSTKRSIFRSKALQHYTQNQNKVVLPDLASPRMFKYLWFVATLFFGAGLLLTFWPWIAP